MAILLNLIAFIACIIWFHRIIDKTGNKLILPVILVYLTSTIVSFILVLALQNDYLNGLIHLLVSGIAILIFWLWTSIVSIVKHAKKGQSKYILTDLAQTSILLIIPLLIVLLISNASFKIGG